MKELTIAATVFGALFGGPFTAAVTFVSCCVLSVASRKAGAA